jgi:hypothetical protein
MIFRVFTWILQLRQPLRLPPLGLDHHSVAAPRASAAEDRLVKNLQPLLPGPDHASQELRFVIKSPLCIGVLSYETVVINDLAFCRAKENSFPELYECSVEPEHVLPARLLPPHRPFSRPEWFRVARLHQGFLPCDPKH